ncbi:Mediator of RNA polymerase II transcription subunit 6 [Vanrija pseudolonga]|uniref:Mediator of RNA polymerase II transcription subunit 6 n=1 Tax=Vanrija pseudolonga TaxID=143232 RepID=A0AAF0Y4W0_9TREE|nr:Mediator of RNA polymerase II transcription subunit 6 [Vanrija pseudolonga]
MADDLEQDLRHIHWSWPEAIAANPARSLATPDLAMDYFAFSPFWDSKSNNNVLRTQRRIENPTYGHAEEKVELTAFRTGFEYIVAHARAPDVFVIHRRDVLPDGGRGPVTHAYFILQDKVYMSPNLHDIAATRLRNATYLLSTTFSALSAAKPAANPRATTQWRALPPGGKDKEKDKGKEADKERRDSVAERRDSVATGTPSAEATAPAPAVEEKEAAPDWHLFHALSATRASLAELDRLAASPEAKADAEAESRAFDALAQAAIGRAPAPAHAHAQAGTTPRPPQPFGTPAPFTPAADGFRPLRPQSNFAPSLAADSPAV